MSRFFSRFASWSLPLFALLGLALAARSPKADPAPVTFGEILAVNNDSLATYKASGTSTPANDIIGTSTVVPSSRSNGLGAVSAGSKTVVQAPSK